MKAKTPPCMERRDCCDLGASLLCCLAGHLVEMPEEQRLQLIIDHTNCLCSTGLVADEKALGEDCLADCP